MSYVTGKAEDHKLTLYNDFLVIGEDRVRLKTSIEYRVIELYCKNTFSIINLLPNNYFVLKRKNIIMIVPFTNDVLLDVELFEYLGNCNIYQAKIYDREKKVTDLYINKNATVTWDNLNMLVDKDGNETIYDWAYLTTWYDKLSFSGNNNYIEKQVKIDYIDEDGNRSKLFKPVKSYSDRLQEDKLGNILGGQYTNGLQYSIEGLNQSYSGYYHIHLKTRTIMTGKEHTENSKKLVKYKARKV